MTSAMVAPGMGEHMETPKENDAIEGLNMCEASDFYESSDDGLEDDNGLLPNQFEPYAVDRSGDESQSESESSDTQTSRLDSAAWCSCASCLPMPTNRECRCCCEIPEMESEMREAGVTCITSHPGFQTVCLDVYVLKTAYYQYRQQYGHKVADLNNCYRYTAYRQLTRFIWGYLGKDIRVTLPSCAVLTIRKQFPSVDGIYTGYLEPQ